MIAAEREKLLRFPVYETDIVNTTGAGDAAAAAIVWADLRGYDLAGCAQFAQLAGSVTCRSSLANNTDLAKLPQLI
jgi:pseudouridine kinase